MEEVNTLEQLAEAIQSGNKSKINEASLSRVYQHVMSDGSESFAIITAYRYQNSKEANMALNKKLEADIRSLGLGFFKLKGYWLECQDSNIEYADCPKDQLVPSIEQSLFVPNINKKQATALAKKYDQDAIVYQGPDIIGNVLLISKSGAKIAMLGKFSPNKIAQGYSKIKGRNFTFEGFEYKPSGMMSNLAFEAYLKKYKK